MLGFLLPLVFAPWFCPLVLPLGFATAKQQQNNSKTKAKGEQNKNPTLEDQRGSLTCPHRVTQDIPPGRSYRVKLEAGRNQTSNYRVALALTERNYGKLNLY